MGNSSFKTQTLHSANICLFLLQQPNCIETKKTKIHTFEKN
ncbi:hypothetical protein L965_1066 [Leuconostoc pseudomesenteroides PS12]|nr:hypothetical protein L964_1458 [Leuconostoc pseudomesenteroides 1159]KDA49533.1 hypothetical protein L965_1066 [Leuconostoc pseudomesenteroides PS12]